MICQPWLRVEAEHVFLHLKIKPGAKQNSLALDATGAFLQVSLQAPAQDGKANKMLIQYLAKKLGLRQKQIMILRGENSRMKIVALHVTLKEQKKLLETLVA